MSFSLVFFVLSSPDLAFTFSRSTNLNPPVSEIIPGSTIFATSVFENPKEYDQLKNATNAVILANRTTPAGTGTVLRASKKTNWNGSANE